MLHFAILLKKDHSKTNELMILKKIKKIGAKNMNSLLRMSSKIFKFLPCLIKNLFLQLRATLSDIN